MYAVTVKQQAKWEQTYHVCLHALEKYEKVESINTLNDYTITGKKWTDKKTCSVCFVNMIKFQGNKFKIVQKKF